VNLLEEKFSALLANLSITFNWNLIESRIDKYLILLQHWNKAYNLTAISELERMRVLHVHDSLAILPLIRGNKIIDIGTGAGLPGVVIAIARPDLKVTLLDSNGKKIRFLQEVRRCLNLPNINIVQSRVEDYYPTDLYNTIVSRAFSSILQMQQWSQHLKAKDGLWLAMKGKTPVAELAEITTPYQLHEYHVPGITASRCCVLL
jgi:16S rRNA (guanine527-N7)-methyltransferase